MDIIKETTQLYCELALASHVFCQCMLPKIKYCAAEQVMAANGKGKAFFHMLVDIRKPTGVSDPRSGIGQGMGKMGGDGWIGPGMGQIWQLWFPQNPNPLPGPDLPIQIYTSNIILGSGAFYRSAEKCRSETLKFR